MSDEPIALERTLERVLDSDLSDEMLLDYRITAMQLADGGGPQAQVANHLLDCIDEIQRVRAILAKFRNPAQD